MIPLQHINLRARPEALRTSRHWRKELLIHCSNPRTLLLKPACLPAQSLQLCLTLYDPKDYSHQLPLSMGFSRQEHWNGLQFPPPGDLPDPGIEPPYPAFVGWLLPLSHIGGPLLKPMVLSISPWLVIQIPKWLHKAIYSCTYFQTSRFPHFINGIAEAQS